MWVILLNCVAIYHLAHFVEIYQFPRWRPSVTLHLLCACLGHARSAFGGLYRGAKFGWNLCSSFENMHVLYFVSLALKCLFRPPKFGFRGLAPKWGDINETPKRHILGRKTSYDA